MSAEFSTGRWGLYQFPPSFVLGFHGCDESVGEAILSGAESHLKPSENDCDWLGKGIYFWESNPQRAWEFAQERRQGGRNSQGNVEKPFVLGAILNLGYCLNLCDSSALEEVKRSHFDLKAVFEEAGLELPVNSGELRVRRLDCAVFDLVHRTRAALQPPVRAYDSIRATYHEGEPLYEGTDLRHQDHTQVCVLNAASILGHFRPIEI